MNRLITANTEGNKKEAEGKLMRTVKMIRLREESMQFLATRCVQESSQVFRLKVNRLLLSVRLWEACVRTVTLVHT